MSTQALKKQCTRAFGTVTVCRRFPRTIHYPRILFGARSGFSQRGQIRHASLVNSFKRVYKDSPIILPVAIISFIGAASYLVHSNYMYYSALKNFANYPENVGLKLKRALYFTDVKFEPVHAARAYQQAIKLAEEEGMNPFSDEVLGIKFEMARFLEMANNYETSIEVLEAVRSDCLQWVDRFGGEEGNAGDRNRLLGKAVQVAVKLAELYSIDFVADRIKAEELLVWAVETSIREKQRRESEGLKRGEGDWLDDDQVGAELERLGKMYGNQGNNYFESQLYLQALALKTETDCHTATLMQNIGMSIGLQRPPPQPSEPPPSPEQLRESGRMWINKAVELARSIQPPLRNSECDEVCIAGAINLAHFFMMDSNINAAREKFEEGGSLANAVGHEQGIVAANEGLRALEDQKSTKRWW